AYREYSARQLTGRYHSTGSSGPELPARQDYGRNNFTASSGYEHQARQDGGMNHSPVYQHPGRNDTGRDLLTGSGRYVQPERQRTGRNELTGRTGYGLAEQRYGHGQSHPYRLSSYEGVMHGHSYNKTRVFCTNCNMDNHATEACRRRFYWGFTDSHTINFASKNINFNEISFCIDLNKVNINEVEQIQDPNEAREVLYKRLNEVLSHHAPLKEKQIKFETQPAWFTDEIRLAI
ncbi:hypothetical protein MAR_014079, partial [Mya arenaria]